MVMQQVGQSSQRQMDSKIEQRNVVTSQEEAKGKFRKKKQMQIFGGSECKILQEEAIEKSGAMTTNKVQEEVCVIIKVQFQ
jgi:hypothetical protein